jgi:hypothetical protein
MLMEGNLKSPVNEALVKILFELPEDSPYGAESLWAEKVAEGKYRLDNSPFYAYGYSYKDVVSAAEKDGALVVTEPCIRGGHSTYRVYLAEGLTVDSPEFETYWRRLKLLGCTYEGASNRLLSIDVPPAADIFSVYRILQDGERAGVWEFEEGHCGHSTEREAAPSDPKIPLLRD